MRALVEGWQGLPRDLWRVLLEEAEAIASEQDQADRRMGLAGATLLPANCRIITHCNAGAWPPSLTALPWGHQDRPRAREDSAGVGGRDAAAAAGSPPDGLGAGAGGHPLSGHLRQHGRSGDGAGRSGRGDHRGRPHRRQRRHRQQDRHLSAGGTGRPSRHTLLRGRAPFHPGPLPAFRGWHPHRGTCGGGDPGIWQDAHHPAGSAGMEPRLRRDPGRPHLRHHHRGGSGPAALCRKA